MDYCNDVYCQKIEKFPDAQAAARCMPLHSQALDNNKGSLRTRGRAANSCHRLAQIFLYHGIFHLWRSSAIKPHALLRKYLHSVAWTSQLWIKRKKTDHVNFMPQRLTCQLRTGIEIWCLGLDLGCPFLPLAGVGWTRKLVGDRSWLFCWDFIPINYI